jgi:hypothetical protein
MTMLHTAHQRMQLLQMIIWSMTMQIMTMQIMTMQDMLMVMRLLRLLLLLRLQRQLGAALVLHPAVLLLQLQRPSWRLLHSCEHRVAAAGGDSQRMWKWHCYLRYCSCWYVNCSCVVVLCFEVPWLHGQRQLSRRNAPCTYLPNLGGMLGGMICC